jgi:inhibitor of KinA
MPVPLHFYPLSEKAIVVAWEQLIDPAIAAQVHRLQQQLTAYPFAGMEEQVPAYSTLTVFFDPIVVKTVSSNRSALQWVEQYIKEQWQQAQQTTAVTAPRRIEIPVQYGGAGGPDLSVVAQHCGMPEAEVIRLHSQAVYQVYLIGFVPGFAYLGGLPPQLATPRRQTPRPAVAAGSVGIAGQQTGIYPMEIPGGWQLIGRTSLRLFNPQQEPPALLQAGDLISFIPVIALPD